jgi:DNA-directed RNA polymerase III subunit RPC2
MSGFVDRVKLALDVRDEAALSILRGELTATALASVKGSVEWIMVDSLLDMISHARVSVPVADKWSLIPAFVQSRGLVRHHIESFDHFVEVVMPKIVSTFGEARCRANPAWVCRFTHVRLGQPSLEVHGMAEASSRVTPQSCRISDSTYSAPVLVRVEYMRGSEGLFSPPDELELGRLPIMLRSKNCVLRGKSERELLELGECPLDPGGYFIVRGLERIILMQEQLAHNRLLVLEDKGVLRAEIQSFSVESKSRAAIVLRKGALFLSHNSLNEDVPFCIALQGLGVESMGQMADLVGSEPNLREQLRPSVTAVALNNSDLKTQEDALRWIGSKIRSRFAASSSSSSTSGSTAEAAARSFLTKSLLCHLRGEELGGFRGKAVFLALMARRVLLAKLNGQHSDGRDFYGNKRVDLAGDMMALLFEVVFRQAFGYVSQKADAYFRKAAQLHPHDVDLPRDTFSSGLKQAIATGNWRAPRVHVDRAGVTQLVSRLSYMSAIGMLGRIRSQFEKARKMTGPRALQPSQWGVVCPADTPEGESCGLVKNLALVTHITRDLDVEPLIELVLSLGTEEVRLLRGGDLWRQGVFAVFVNGALVGVHSRPLELTERLRAMRRCGQIAYDVSIAFSDANQAVTLLCDGGRLCRPVLLVSREGNVLLQQKHCDELARGARTFQQCVDEGLVEFLDVSEEDDCLLALHESDIVAGKTTHLEIDPMTILGILAGLIPYPHHNQSPRNTYQCAMGKQAMCIYALNQLHRTDLGSFMLVYSQRPLVKTKTLDLIGFEQIPAGHNAIVAVMSFTGYDIEDAVILNQASVDRGFGRCVYSSTITDVVHVSDFDKRESRGPPSSKHAHLDPEDGLVCRGTRVARDMVLAEKRVGEGSKTSVLKHKGSAEGVVQQVILSENGDGESIAKIKVVETRVPEIGDKFSSRHGQKGVVGLIVPQEDMPFSDQGIVPDLVMNPHGFPSRMTVGKMLELLGCK